MLQFITHQTDRFSTYESALLALRGGCRWIQLRMKESAPETILETARVLRRECNRYKATLIIDDQVEIADRANADGVHLGKNDMPPAEARKYLGSHRIIGGTANTLDDMLHLVQAGVDYIGLGPFRFTETKKKLSPVIGINGYDRIMAECRRRQIKLPVVAIGGITAADIPELMRTGIGGIALSGAILRADDPQQETARILKIMNSEK